MALYKGALPRFFWIAPLGAMNFAGYELAKRAMEDQDRRQAREAEVAAEAELRALEEAEAKQRRAAFPQFSKLPDLREKLPRLRTALSDLRTRASKLRTSGQRIPLAGRVKGLVEQVGRRNKTETETETAGNGRVNGEVGGRDEMGSVGRVEKEALNQTLGKVELEEVRGETGFKGLVARVGKQRKGGDSVGGFNWPGRSTGGEKGSGKGVMKGVVERVGGHREEEPIDEKSNQPLKSTSEEKISDRVKESGATAVRKGEGDTVKREEEAPPAGSTSGASGRFGAAGGETRPASVTLEQRERRGLFAGVHVPGIFKRPQKADSNGNDNSPGPATSRASVDTADEKRAIDAQSDDDALGLGGSIVAVPKKDDVTGK
eukprot:TRINITY_DN969_c0_g2_i1.p1 TRINITY_DN969_c0_g2~~TRINITY_DN969_c0_g2_i1.p1  ORF type:complete len:425 (-),score=90.37 TRINITY_DN969_c0_g2_i1:338-1462(-)